MSDLNSPLLRLLIGALLGFSLVGCGGERASEPDSGQPDVVDAPDAEEEPDADTKAEPDASEDDDPLKPSAEQPGVEPGGHPDVDAPLAPGEVRAGKIEGPDTGFEGVWAQCRPGDFRLYNAEIMVCIQAESTNLFEVYTGGIIVDARRVDDAQEDALGMITPLVGLGTTLVDKVEVVRDGSDGEQAVLRVSATDTGIAHVYGLLGAQLNRQLDLKIITEYRLQPDTDAVEIVTWYQNPNSGVRSFEVGDWFIHGDRTAPFFPGNPPESTSPKRYHWLAAVGEGHSFGWVPDSEEEARDTGLGGLGIPWAGAEGARLKLAAGAEDVFRRWFVVGDGTLAIIKEREAQLRGREPQGARRTLKVETAAGEPLVGHLVEVWRGEIEVDRGYTDEHGQVILRLEDGEYQTTIEGFAASEPFERTLILEDEEPTLQVDSPGVLNLKISDKESAELFTSRVMIGGGSGWSGVALHGERSLKLLPGSYTVVAAHGPKYDTASQEVLVEAGEALDIELEIPRAFSTDGWLAGDFHQHMEPSIDSEVSVDDRLLENASVGVEIVVPTDHEVITDLAPVVEKYSLGDELATFPGAEVSPIETHIGMYPMEQDKSARGNGSIQLAVRDESGEQVKRLIPEVVAIARELPNDPVLQLNHARNSSSGMLEQVGFDPEIGPDAVEDDRFTIDFDAMEIINRYRDTCKLLADWSGLLNAGVRLTGLGNSDTHGLSGETGLPRNFLRVDKSVTELQPDDVRQAIRKGRVTVGSHAFIDFSDGKLPGDLLSVAPGEAVDFGVRVQTPNWAKVDKLVAVVNGEVLEVLDRPAEASEHLDFDETISLSVDQDSWVVFVAYGGAPDPIIGSNKRVMAFTNPVFIDTDGDQDGDGDAFEAPGIKPLALDELSVLCE